MLGGAGRGRWGMIEALRYKPEVRKFDSQRDYWLNPSGRTVALNSIQPIIEISIRGITWEGGGVKAADVLVWAPCHFHVPII